MRELRADTTKPIPPAGGKGFLECEVSIILSIGLVILESVFFYASAAAYR